MSNSGLGLTVPPFYDPLRQGYSTNSSTSATTSLVEADIYGGSSEHTLSLTGVITAASNAQLPTVVALILAMVQPVLGQTWKLRIINAAGTGLGVWTIINASNSSWSLNGTMTVPPGTYRDFYVTLSSLTTATIQNIQATVVPPALSTLSDVNVTEGSGINGYTLNWNNGASMWEAVAPIPPFTTVLQQYTTNSSTSASLALVAADIQGGFQEHTLNLTGAITSASHAQLPTVPDLVTAMGNAVIGQTWKLRIINGGGSSAGVWTIINATDSSWTINGTPTIAITLGFRDFYITLTSLTAAVLQSIGSGTLTDI